MHLSFTTVVSAFSWATIVGCFVVMSLQLTWQLVIMLLIVWNRPGRSLMHNTFIIAQAVNQLAIVIAQIISLDCGGVFPQNVQGAEILIRITLVLYFALATAACVGIYFERGHRVRTQSEAQAAEYKMREETLMLNAASTQSNLDLVKSRAAGIPALPNIKFHESQARVSTAESTSVVERQRSLAAGADEDVTLEWKRVQESAEMRELVQASRARRWREHSVEVEAVEEEHANSAGSSLRMHAARAKGLIGPVSHSALPTSTFQETSAGTLASRSTTAGRCRRCLKLQQSLSSYGVCFNCDSLNFL
jgi:hypothetical protein